MFQIHIIIPNPVQGIPCGRRYPQIQPELAQAALFLFQPPAILLTDCIHERMVDLLLHSSRFLFRTAGMIYPGVYGQKFPNIPGRLHPFCRRHFSLKALRPSPEISTLSPCRFPAAMPLSACCKRSLILPASTWYDCGSVLCRLPISIVSLPSNSQAGLFLCGILGVLFFIFSSILHA